MLQNILGGSYDRVNRVCRSGGEVLKELEIRGVDHGHREPPRLHFHRQDKILTSNLFRKERESVWGEVLAAQVDHGESQMQGCKRGQIPGKDESIPRQDVP